MQTRVHKALGTRGIGSIEQQVEHYLAHGRGGYAQRGLDFGDDGQLYTMPLHTGVRQQGYVFKVTGFEWPVFGARLRQ